MHHLIGQQGDHAEHQMTEHFPIAAHPDMLRPELVLEAAEEALHRRVLPVQPRVRLDQGNMAEAERAFADFPGVISAVHEIAENVRPFGRCEKAADRDAAGGDIDMELVSLPEIAAAPAVLLDTGAAVA